MKVTFRRPLFVVRNTLLPNSFADYTSDVTNWRLHSDAKYYFNVHEFLIRVGREDVLARHFDHLHPNDLIRESQYRILNGKSQKHNFWCSNNASKTSALDDEMEMLIKAHPDDWDEVKERKINWQKQKIFVFDKVETLEY